MMAKEVPTGKKVDAGLGRSTGLESAACDLNVQKRLRENGEAQVKRDSLGGENAEQRV